MDWIVVLKVKDGQLDAFTALMEGVVAATREKEPGTMNYERVFGEDERTRHIHERYIDSAATMVQFKTFGEAYVERFTALAEPAGFTLYGKADIQVVEALAAIHPTRKIEIGGFAR